MFQHLDDPLPLPDSSREQRAAVIASGQRLRRRRRAGVVGLSIATAAVAASAVGALTVVLGSSGSQGLTPAAPAPPQLHLQEPTQTGAHADLDCADRVGDSAGEVDVAYFSVDRPAYPLVHYGLVAGEMPSTGLVDLRFEAMSADGGRSRHLVQRIADGTVTEQYVLDPSTGARRDVPLGENPYGGSGSHSGSARFPGGALSGLGDGWTWAASLTIDGTVVDSCDAGPGQP